MAQVAWNTEGPLNHLADHRTEVQAALAARDRAPVVHRGDARDLSFLDDGEVDLVVTSPPYPYIEMWDEQLADLLGVDPDRFAETRELVAPCHELLAEVWAECHRVLGEGGMLCVNIGDATRTIGGAFQCIQNHAHVVQQCVDLGFQPMVPILWKKPTTKPNSFLGSGFLPTNGYVTLDCEHILLFRKGGKRAFPARDPLRYASSFSKEERDRWFSQVWTVPGARQAGQATFPEEIPRRLVRMFSVLGDTVLDPFAGTGTTLAVAKALGRRPVGVELDEGLAGAVRERVGTEAAPAEEVLDRLHARYEDQGATPVAAPADGQRAGG